MEGQSGYTPESAVQKPKVEAKPAVERERPAKNPAFMSKNEMRGYLRESRHLSGRELRISTSFAMTFARGMRDAYAYYQRQGLQGFPMPQLTLEEQGGWSHYRTDTGEVNFSVGTAYLNSRPSGFLHLDAKFPKQARQWSLGQLQSKDILYFNGIEEMDHAIYHDQHPDMGESLSTKASNVEYHAQDHEYRALQAQYELAVAHEKHLAAVILRRRIREVEEYRKQHVQKTE